MSRVVLIAAVAISLGGCLEANPAWDPESIPSLDDGESGGTGTGESGASSGEESGSGDGDSSTGTTTTSTTDSGSDSSDATGTDTSDSEDSVDTGDTGTAPDPVECGEATGEIVACYDFETVASGILENRVGPSLHGTTQLVDAVDGQPGIAGMFQDGSIAVIGHDQGLNPEEITVEGWIRVESFAGVDEFSMIISKPGQFDFSVRGDGKIRCAVSGVGSLVGGAVTAGVWTHFACVYDGELHMWQDAQPRGVVGDGDAFPQGTADVRLGNTEAMDQPYKGRLDTLRVWREALGESELCVLAGTC